MGGEVRYLLAITAGATVFVLASVAMSHASWAQPFAGPRDWNLLRLSAALLMGAAVTFFGCDNALRRGHANLPSFLFLTAVMGCALFGALNARAPAVVVIYAALIGFAVGALCGIAFWLIRRPDRDVREQDRAQ